MSPIIAKPQQGTERTAKPARWAKPLSPMLHGVGDYVAALTLIVAPHMIPLGHNNPLASTLTVAAGFLLIGYSLLTNYLLGIFKVLPFKIHLVLDTAAAVSLALAPVAFGFSGLDLAYYEAVAASLLVVISLTRQ